MTQLKFRGISDSLAEHHLEGSECCLIHADNPLTKSRGVFLNPQVRVGYNIEAYLTTHPANGSWVSVWQIMTGLWMNRLKRWTDWSFFEGHIIKSRLKRWSHGNAKNQEPGDFCLIDEMQVLIENGWAHV